MTKEITIISRATKSGTRYFTDPPKIGGFDGTAQGYGYKTEQGLRKALWYQQNKGKIAEKDKRARGFLKQNPEIDALFNLYMDEDECFHRMKDGEPTSMKDFLERIQGEHPEAAAVLRGASSLHSALMKLAGDM